MAKSFCQTCDDLIRALLEGHHEKKAEVYNHLHTCPITTAACDAAREQLAAREAVPLEVPVEELLEEI